MEEEGQTDTYGRTFKALTGFLPLSQHGKTTEAHTRTPSLHRFDTRSACSGSRLCGCTAWTV